MKDVGAGVWWVDVHLAGQSGVTRRNHAPEQFIVERAGDAAAAPLEEVALKVSWVVSKK